jgi:hypothetical protein
VTPQVCLQQADAFLALGRRHPRVAWLCTRLAREWQRTAEELGQKGEWAEVPKPTLQG